MNKVDKSQIIVLSILTLLLLITPLLPPFLKPTYLYFIFNILIIALGAQAGLLSPSSDPSPSSENRKQSLSSTLKPEEPEEKETFTTNIENKPKVVKVVEKSVVSEKIVEVVVKATKCSSVPSIFFIGGSGEEAEVMMDEEFEGEVDENNNNGVNGQELFAKAEAFIGNFYKQLKMQREDSWISHKAYSRI